MPFQFSVEKNPSAGSIVTAPQSSGSTGGFKFSVEQGGGTGTTTPQSADVQRLTKQGEDINKIFSGGFIQDTFDTLNLLQYGVTGIIKGKGFMEGVRTRQSFSDKDALGQYGLPGVIAGIALDIAVDPLTWISPISIFRKIPGATKAAKAVGSAISNIPLTEGQKLGSLFIYRFGQDPAYAKLAERTVKNIAIGNQNLIDLARPLTKLDPVAQRAIAAARKAGDLSTLTPDILAKAKPAFDQLDELGKAASQTLGYKGKPLLDPGIWQENVGKYIARLYRGKEEGVAQKTVNFLMGKKPLRLDLSRFMKRTDIPEEVRKAMGEILEAGYPTAKALTQLNASIENAKFFGAVAKQWGKKAVTEGFEQLPDTARLGQLAGQWLPKAIASDINEIIRIPEKTIGKQLVAAFKFNKVILNPATHARNIASNFILNNFEGLSPARVDIYGEAAKELVTKGKWYQEAKAVGLGLDTFAAKEIKELLTDPNNLGNLGKIKGVFGKTADTLSDIYSKEEEFAKLAQFIFQRKAGKTAEEAWSIAERATFNYAQVTPFIRRVRESLFGFPFVTFTYKATPQVLKTLVTKPTKISNIGKIKKAIENLSDQKELAAEREVEPDWIRDGFYVKLPFKDKFNRSAYFDLTYILPFGDLVSGQYFERGIERETGLPETAATALLKKTPLINMIKELARNQDFYGNKIVKNSDDPAKQSADIFTYLVRQMMPPAIGEQFPGGYRADGTRRPPLYKRIQDVEGKGIEEGRASTRTLYQELLRNLGAKITPYDLITQTDYAERQRQRALDTLMLERGEAREFKRVYVPKK